MLVTELGVGGLGLCSPLACHLLETGNEADAQCPDLGTEGEARLTAWTTRWSPPGSDQKLPKIFLSRAGDDLSLQMGRMRGWGAAPDRGHPFMGPSRMWR